jgi:hypothetical protein
MKQLYVQFDTKPLPTNPMSTAEQDYVRHCNSTKHKLILVRYHSGDDHDSWVVNCTKCTRRLIYVTQIAEPDLNYCMNCITPDELIQVKPNLDKVSGTHYIMAKGGACDTPWYI